MTKVVWKLVKNSRICGVIVLKHEFEKHQLKVGNMLATFNSLQRPLLDDNPANDHVFDAQLIHDVNFSIDYDVWQCQGRGVHGAQGRQSRLEKACMGHKFKAVEQFRDKSSSQRVSRRIGRFLILLDMCLQSKITSTHCILCPLNIYITKLGQFNFFFYI